MRGRERTRGDAPSCGSRCLGPIPPDPHAWFPQNGGGRGQAQILLFVVETGGPESNTCCHTGSGISTGSSSVCTQNNIKHSVKKGSVAAWSRAMFAANKNSGRCAQAPRQRVVVLAPQLNGLFTSKISSNCGTVCHLGRDHKKVERKFPSVLLSSSHAPPQPKSVPVDTTDRDGDRDD